MCITFFHLPPDAGHRYKLILAMNRDEFLLRPTMAAAWQEDLLAGWDLQEGRQGGTWLAADRRGRVALLTNIYTGGVMDKTARGRGHLVVDYLKGHTAAATYLERLAAEDAFYNPFNMVLLEPDLSGEYSAWLYSRGLAGHTNNFGPAQVSCRSGTYGVSNHPHGAPYRKSLLGQQIMETIVETTARSGLGEDELISQLEVLLRNRDENWPDPQMVAQSAVRGSAGPFQRLTQRLSSIFVDISDADYGTRTHTIILVDKENRVTFYENTREKNEWKTSKYNFNF